MMFDLTHPLPKRYWVACSGGIDSMAALHWLNKPNSGLLGVVHINHRTIHASITSAMVQDHCRSKGIPCLVYSVEKYIPEGESKESWWRDQRYRLFENVPGDEPIILAHHFDDCLEEYIMSTMVRGHSGTIPYQHGRCIRPFRKWKKKDIVAYAERNSIKWILDISNGDTKFKRNYIRHKIVPQILELNRGVYNIVKEAIRKQDMFNDDNNYSWNRGEE